MNYLFSRAVIAAALASIGPLSLAATGLTYPATQKTDHVDTYFGTAVPDPYRWLEDDNSAETKAWVTEENKVTADYLAGIPFRGDVLKRVQSLVNYAKYSAPFTKNGYVYFYKNDGLQNQSVLYVQKGEKGKPEVLLDPNTFSPDGTVRLTSFDLNKRGNYASYGKTAIPGSDWHDIYVMDMKTHKTLPEVIHWVKYADAHWRGNGFYYSRFPEPDKDKVLTAKNEHQQVYYHKVGTPQSADVLVYEDKAHPDFYVWAGTSEDERFAIVSEQDPSKLGNTLAIRDDSKHEQAFRPMVTQNTDSTYSVLDNIGDKLLIVTNQDAPNNKVMQADASQPLVTNWKPFIPEQAELLERVTTAGHKLFATYLKDVTAHAYVYGEDGQRENEIALPGPGSVGGFGGEKTDKQTYYVFSSQNYPSTIFKYDIRRKASSLFRAPDIKGFKSDDYESHEVFFNSKDGTRVPMFLVYKKGLQLNGKNPTLVYGYGGFDITLNPTFSAARIAWLEQGGVYAMVNLRGGGEYGEKWHEAGMRFNKQNVFDDCIAAAQYLVHEKYTSPDYLALNGGSNGGLLVAAVVNQRPDLFKVAVPEVGVMDMLRFQRFSAGTGWVADYGSSDDEKQFHYLLGYSPLHNIKAGVDYPAMMVITSDHDDRVVPAHSFKYIATLQEKAGGNAPHLIRIETNSGHGASNLSKSLAEVADVYSFIWANMGLTPKY